MGLAAALGGSWCLAGVRGEGNANMGFARGLSGPGGARGRAAGEDEAFSTPLLWGGVEGEKSARAAVRALEATASVEGSAAAAAAARGIPLRARETAAWGLALVVDCAVARAGASAGSVSGTSSAAVTKSGSGTNSGASASSLGGAIGVLAETVLAAPPEGSSPMAPARALSLLARLDRLPAGDWPGALRRWTRASKAISGDDEVEGEGDEDEGDDAAAAAAASIRAACVDFAVAHPGPSAGASLLETLLGAGGGSDAVFDPDPDPDRDFDATARATALPPAAVCARLDACVAALPPSAANAALRRVVAAASETTRRMNDASASASASVAALWSGISSAASRLPRGPWTSGEIIDALATLAGSLSRADGPEMDAAVESLSATPSAIGAARVATLAADERAAAPAAEALRARLAARGALALADVPPLSAWRPREGLASRVRALAPKLRDAPAPLRARWLEEAAALHRGEGLATVAALAAAWAPGPASTFAGDPERDARALPATLPATTRTIAREGAGDGVGGAGRRRLRRRRRVVAGRVGGARGRGGGGGGARDAGTRARGDVAQARVDPRDGDVGVTIRIPGAVGRFCFGARREGSENGTAWKIKRNAFFIHDARGPRGKSHAENWCRVHTPRS